MFPTIAESAAVVLIMLLLVPYLPQLFQDLGRGIRAPASILFLAALTRFSPHRVWRGLHFALLCIARVLGWCDHDYPRWGGHNTPVRLTTVQLFHVLVAPASLNRAGAF